MSKKVRLNLDELKVQSFVTTIDSKERVALQGAGPLQESLRCSGWGQCGVSGAYCYDTNDACSIGNTDSLTCTNETTYCTQYSFCEPTSPQVCPSA